MNRVGKPAAVHQPVLMHLFNGCGVTVKRENMLMVAEHCIEVSDGRNCV